MSGLDWLGEFEQLVLLATLQDEDAYGASIAKAIQERTGRTTSAGAVYTTLDRLEKRGLVTSTWGEATPERGGKRKRHFRLRPAGREALARSIRAVRVMSRGVTPKLERS